jgi:hypothetical protein
MCAAMRQYGTLTEIHERAQVIALMRLYAKRWRVVGPRRRALQAARAASKEASNGPEGRESTSRSRASSGSGHCRGHQTAK